MKIRVIDWGSVIFMILFAPFLLVVLYMVVSSSVTGVENILWYIYFYLAVFVWILLNNLLGYFLNKNTKSFTYPTFFGLLRRRAVLSEMICYRLIGFDEYATTNTGLGFRNFKLILKSRITQYEVIFSRKSIARKVVNELKTVLPTECTLERLAK